MKMVIALALILAIGCVKTSEPAPKEEPIKTRPNLRKKPTRMVADVQGDRIKTVAVIDTGFGFSPYTMGVKLCQFGHRDFTTMQVFETRWTKDPVPVDNHGHGTNIAGVIQDNAGYANFCMVVIKYYDPRARFNDNLVNTVKAIEYAAKIKADFINYSGGGTEFSKKEQLAVKKYLDGGGKFIAAAGNEGKDLADAPYYPAMDDDRVIAVGNVDHLKRIVHSSNRGSRVNCWEIGQDAIGFGIRMTGTSQAAAVATGKMLNNQECDK